MKLIRSRLLLLPVLTVAALFGHAFHAQEDPNESFLYDRTESVLSLSLEAPGGVQIVPTNSTLPLGVLATRHSWEIWKQASSGTEETRNAWSAPEVGISVSLTSSPDGGHLAETTLLTDSEGRASTSLSTTGSSGTLRIEAAHGENMASLDFEITESTPFTETWTESPPEETWTYSHTEATLVAELTCPDPSGGPGPLTAVAPGESRDLSLRVSYESWDVIISTTGQSRLENFSRAPAEGALVNWSAQRGDGSVSGYGQTDGSGLCQGSFTMGSGSTVVRTEISYASGHSTFATLQIEPAPPGGGGSDTSFGTTWMWMRTENVPVLVNLSADGPTAVAPGDSRTLTGQVRMEYWDYWSQYGPEERRFNYSVPLPWASVRMEVLGEDGTPVASTLSANEEGWFQVTHSMGSTPVQLLFYLGEDWSPAATVDLTLDNRTDPGGPEIPPVTWHYLHSHGRYQFAPLQVNGTTYDLLPGDRRHLEGSLNWISWEVWGDDTGNTENRNSSVTPALGANLTAHVNPGDGTLESNQITTGSQGEFSVPFTMGAESSRVNFTVEGNEGLAGGEPVSTSLDFTPPPGVVESWTHLRNESSLSITLAAESLPMPTLPGQIVPVRTRVTATTWEVWQNQDGTIELRNHTSGPAMGARIQFGIDSGGGQWMETSGETDADGSVVSGFQIDESLTRVYSEATFQGATGRSELLVGPQGWDAVSHHAELELTLVSLGEPATGLSARVNHRTWEEWLHTASGTRVIRRESTVPATNARVDFTKIAGAGHVTFAPESAYTGTDGGATTGYRSENAVTVRGSASFAGLTTQTTLNAPRGWGQVGLTGSNTDPAGPTIDPTNPTGPNHDPILDPTLHPTLGPTLDPTGPEPSTSPPIEIKLLGHGIIFSAGSKPNEPNLEIPPDDYDYSEAYSPEEKSTMESEGWTVVRENTGPDPADPTQNITISWLMRRPKDLSPQIEKNENTPQEGKPFESVARGEPTDEPKTQSIEGVEKVKTRIEKKDPYSSLPGFEPESWGVDRRAAASSEHATLIMANYVRELDVIYPHGAYRCHVWTQSTAPVTEETTKTYVVVKTFTTRDKEKEHTLLGTATFTIPAGKTVSTKVEFDGATSQEAQVISTDPGVLQICASNPGNDEANEVKLLTPKVEELSPRVKNEEGNEITGSEKPNIGKPLTPFVEEDPHNNRIAHRELKVDLGEELEGKEVTWTLDAIPGATPATIRGEWEDSETHDKRFENSATYPGFWKSYEDSDHSAKTIVDKSGFTAIRVNVPPIGFNQVRIKIQIEGLNNQFELIDMEVPAVVVIDPGHGTGPHFSDSAAIGGEADDSGELEHAFNLDVSKRTRMAIKSHEETRLRNVKVFLTREDTVNISAVTRTKVARENGCDVYVSIHFNDSISREHRDPFGMWDLTGNENLEEDRALAVRLREEVNIAISEIEPVESRNSDRSNYDSIHWESELQKGLDTCSDLQGGSPYNGNTLNSPHADRR